MNLENFEFIPSTGFNHEKFKQIVLQFEKCHHLSVLVKNDNEYSIEMFVNGFVKNPFDSNCSGTIDNISKETINKYILMLSIYTGSVPVQI
jgi:hypothetical protein